MAHPPTPEPRDDDPRWLDALRRREEWAFDRLVRTYQDRVYGLCFRLLGSPEEARDVAQEVFVSVFGRIDRFRGDARLSTWIHRVAVNHAKNRVKYLARRNDRRGESWEDLLSPPPEGRFQTRPARPDEALDGDRLQAFLHRALSLLDHDQREAVVLRDMEGMSYEEVCEVTGANLGTVKSRLHRGRLRLQEALEAWMAGRDVTGAPGAVPVASAPAAATGGRGSR